MNNKQKIIRGSVSIILGVVMLISFIVLGNKDWSSTQVKDNVKFKEEYPSITEDNLFKYKNIKEATEILKKGNGIIYIGFPECPSCETYAKYINDVATEMELEEIYYFNIYVNRKNNTAEYKSFISLLGDKVSFNDEGEKTITVPALIVVKEGNVLYYHDGRLLNGSASEMNWSLEEINEFKNTLRNEFNSLK